MPPAAGSPRVVVTLMVAADQPDPDNAARRNRLYLDAVERHGATPVALDASTAPDERDRAVAAMDGLLLSGGADVNPSLYGQVAEGARGIETGRDALERAAWDAAEARSVPVLGICRGLQAMNVFAGGRLRQHVDGHAGPGWGSGEALTHPLRLIPGTRMTRILYPANVGGGVLTVNSYHHQGVLRADLAIAVRGERRRGVGRRRARRGLRVDQRTVPDGRPVPPRAHRVHATRVRGAVRVLRRRVPGSRRAAADLGDGSPTSGRLR